MLKTLAVVVGSVIVAGSLAAPSQAAPAGPAAGQTPARPAATPAAPPPGSPGTYKSNAELMEAVRKNISPTGEMTVSEVSINDQYRITMVNRGKPAGALAHLGYTELHYIISGAATIVTGGTIVKAANGDASGATIVDGVARRVTPGDVVIVPENSAHWYSEVEGQITYLEVRWLAPKK